MAQNPLDEYFASTRSRETPRKITFLHLPLSLRRRIYLDAGLPSSATIHLNYHPPVDKIGEEVDYPELDTDANFDDVPHQGSVSRRTISLSHFLEGPPYRAEQVDRLCNCQFGPHDGWPLYNCDSPALPHSLLYVSKSIWDEVSSIFWSENTFSICCNEIDGLSVLKSLPSRRLAIISSLIIRLNCRTSVCSCDGPICEDWSHPECMNRLWNDSFMPLQRNVADFQPLLKKWKSLCQYLKPKIAPRQLKLYLVSDVADVLTAKDIVEPLLQLPLLKECAVRFGRMDGAGDGQMKASLAQLAASTAFQSTGQLDLQPFRFLDLPEEIQLKILEFTDLTTPYDIQWGPDARLGTPEPSYLPLEYRLLHDMSTRLDPFDHFTCCGKCCHASDAQNCACRTRYLVYSTTCTCWRLPASLFLVSRRIGNMAEGIFYSQNHFVAPVSRYEDSPLEINRFFRQLPVRAIQHLRHLTWIIGHVNQRFLAALYQWDDALKILGQQGALPHLTLTIDLSTRWARWPHQIPPINSRAATTNDLLSDEWEVGTRIAGALSSDGRLKRLFFHASWPSGDEDADMRRLQAETKLESFASGYVCDSLAGKFDRRHAWNGFTCGKRDCESCGPQVAVNEQMLDML